MGTPWTYNQGKIQNKNNIPQNNKKARNVVKPDLGVGLISTDYGVNSCECSATVPGYQPLYTDKPV
jgi:hypothetical protein